MRSPPVSVTVDRRTRAPHYPVNLELRDEPVLVVGGGAVAERKVRGLLDAGATVTVVAPVAVAGLRDDPAVRWHRREYQRGEAASYRVVISATGIDAVDEQVARDARATGVPVNSADDPANCTFTLPAVTRLGDIQITVSTAGRSPAFAGWLKDRVEALLDESLIDVLDLLAEVRGDLHDAGVSTESPAWRRALDSGLPELVAQGRVDEARTLLRAQLALDGLHGTGAIDGIDGTDPRGPAS
jgi:precorrin-2 dehydrogenase / sirohydrochlorin ferrochelatase